MDQPTLNDIAYYTYVKEASKIVIDDETGEQRNLGKKIFVVGYTGADKRVQGEVNYNDWQPYLFQHANEKTGWADIFGRPVEKVEFKTISQARKAIREIEEYDNGTPYLGLTQFDYLYIHDRFRNMKYNINAIKEMVLDIEVDVSEKYPDIDVADNKITAITMMFRDITVALGFGDYTPADSKIKYLKCKDEKELLFKFVRIWHKMKPDVVTGWNINHFDIPYIYNRMKVVFGSPHYYAELSPFSLVQEKTIDAFGGKKATIHLPVGVSIIDYIDVYKKFKLQMQESYSLNNIASVELGETKTDYSQYESLTRLYEENHQLFMEYNVRDCELVFRIDAKMKYLSLMYEFAYDSGTNFIDALGAVLTWDVAIHNYLMDRHIVVPAKIEREKNERPVGGHVKPTQVGMYDWVVSFDLQSLYPHLIMAYNISPEMKFKKIPRALTVDDLLKDGVPTGVSEWLDENDCALAANCVAYKKIRQGFLPHLMETLFEKRKHYKDLMKEAKKEYSQTKNEKLLYDIARYDNLQQAAKVKLNSAYGVLSNRYFRWFDKDMAESITMSGQLTIRTAEKQFNDFLNEKCGTQGVDYIIASDTDSCYMNLGPLMKTFGEVENSVDFLDSYCESTIQPMLSQMYENLALDMHCYKQAMYMKRESISSKGVFSTKKRYLLYLHDNEGIKYNPPDIKVTGLEAVRSTTPFACREAIKKAYKVILTGSEQEIQTYISDFRKKFMTLPVEDIAFPKGMNGLEKYSDDDSRTGYIGKTPIQVRGSIVYNRRLEELGLAGTFSQIFDGEKVKFVYLRVPNPTKENVICFPSVLPKQFNLHKYIDYEEQFRIGFLDPIKRILDIMKWKTEKKATLKRAKKTK